MDKNLTMEVIAGFFRSNRLKLSTAESITAGLVSAGITTLPGASTFYQGGFVAYTRSAKKKMLKISRPFLIRETPYSLKFAEKMALNARKLGCAHVCLAVTGLAGPGNDNSPQEVLVGDVFFAIALSNRYVISRKEIFPGNREEIRTKAAAAALEFLRETLEQNQTLICQIYKKKVSRLQPCAEK
ncbi:MAG: CinA family protein [Candidatus Wallbacteria bacterium]|nr:CinA family protein [Candidatus Wallbacteria bacterium]